MLIRITDALTYDTGLAYDEQSEEVKQYLYDKSGENPDNTSYDNWGRPSEDTWLMQTLEPAESTLHRYWVYQTESTDWVLDKQLLELTAI